MKRTIVLCVVALAGCASPTGPRQPVPPEIVAIHSESFAGIHLGEPIIDLQWRFSIRPRDPYGPIHTYWVYPSNRSSPRVALVSVVRNRVASIAYETACSSPANAMARFEATRKAHDLLRETRDYEHIASSFETVIDGQRVKAYMSFHDEPKRPHCHEVWSYVSIWPILPASALPGGDEGRGDADDGPADEGDGDGPVRQP
jgi:hypothetical protein